MPRRNYRRLLLYAISAVSAVSIFPLLVLTWINYHQYQQLLHAEQVRPIHHLTSSATHAMEFFLTERLSALSFIVESTPIADLEEDARLAQLLEDIKTSFGGFVDLELVSSSGDQLSYAGPYMLGGKSYRNQDWFIEVTERGVYVSDVFMGYRQLPHFVIAVRHDGASGERHVLRCTIETDMIERQILDHPRPPSYDAALINRAGTLQTATRHFGEALDRFPFPVPPYSPHEEVIRIDTGENESLIVGYAYVARSPFILLLMFRPDKMASGWLSLRRELIIILATSILLILTVVISGAAYMVRSMRESDLKRASLYQNMAYTNRMAVIGRLAAGVAHEINNPLAIINEKAGLLGDLFTLSETPPSRERILDLVGVISSSVERCGVITHRLLGFAKHMDIRQEPIDIGALLREVLSFLDKEAHYRAIDIRFEIPDDLPKLISDPGQLQQAFLNLINNAFAAVADNGRIDIIAAAHKDDTVSITIKDDGIGIPKKNLYRVFEPFFTTKDGKGTGLGLSITYGIVEKLGGTIAVTSEPGQGTCFTVSLPADQSQAKPGRRP